MNRPIRSLTRRDVRIMPTKSFVLTDVAQGIWADTFELRESAGSRLAGGSDWSIRKRTLRGGVSEGVDVVELHNGALSVAILPTRGMGLWRGNYQEVELGWNSPVKQPVNPCYVNQTDQNGLGWLRGFNELLCRCGLASNGPPGLDVIIDKTGHKTETPLTLHGKIANTPAHHVEATISTEGEGRITIQGIVDETMMFGSSLQLKTTYETVPALNRLTIRDEVLNTAGRPAELQLLYHTNFGKPLLDAGARLVLPTREAAPRDARAAEDVKELADVSGPDARICRTVLLRRSHRRRPRTNSGPAAQRRGRQGGEPGVQHSRIALFHRLEVHAGGSRRLRDRARAGDKPAEPQDV